MLSTNGCISEEEDNGHRWLICEYLTKNFILDLGVGLGLLLERN